MGSRWLEGISERAVLHGSERDVVCCLTHQRLDPPAMAGAERERREAIAQCGSDGRRRQAEDGTCRGITNGRGVEGEVMNEE